MKTCIQVSAERSCWYWLSLKSVTGAAPTNHAQDARASTKPADLTIDLIPTFRANCVKLRPPLFNQSLTEEPGRKLWLTKKNARIRRAPASRSPAPNTVVLPAKEPATRSSWTVIARTKSVREISELAFECADKSAHSKTSDYCWCFAITTARCSAIAGFRSRSFCCCSRALCISPSMR